MSNPINAYPAKGDREVIPEGLPSMPSGMSGNVAGVATNHSSLTSSANSAEGGQWNDDEDTTPSAGHLDPGGYDPNLSGPHPTEPLHDWKAGDMSGWCENDDYMDFTFETSNVAESRLYGYHSVHDADYDDNGGYPTAPRGAEAHADHSAFGTDESAHQGSWGEGMQSSQGGISIEPIIRR